MVATNINEICLIKVEGVEEVQAATAEMEGQIRLAVPTELIPVAAQV